jgi:hypothetical protein
MPNNIYESGMTPINKAAGRVMSRGEEYAPQLKPWSGVEQKTPIPIRELREIPVNLRHLIGYRFGRMTVIGFAQIPKRWSVRCSCGVYCIRSTKAICNPNNINDACRVCSDMLFKLRRDHRLRTGKDVDVTDLPLAHAARAPLPAPVKGGPQYVAHNRNRSADPPPRKQVPLHWSEQQRAIPSTMASAFSAALADKAGKGK